MMESLQWELLGNSIHWLKRDIMYMTTLEEISVKACTLDPKVNKPRGTNVGNQAFLILVVGESPALRLRELEHLLVSWKVQDAEESKGWSNLNYKGDQEMGLLGWGEGSRWGISTPVMCEGAAGEEKVAGRKGRKRAKRSRRRKQNSSWERHQERLWRSLGEEIKQKLN